MQAYYLLIIMVRIIGAFIYYEVMCRALYIY
jgi:hypothetical protein